MIFELLFSIVLFLFAGYCLFYITTSVAVSTVSDPLGSALWPQILLVLLMITLLLNMYWLIKKAPKGESIWAPIKNVDWKKALTSPLFLGMAGILVYAAILNTTGFLLTSFVLCMYFCYILGERRLWVLPVFSFATVVVLFILFYKGMGIQMPRGTITGLRNFALFVEKILRSIG